MKIVATVTAPVQIGINKHQDVSTSRVFDTCRSIDDVVNWARGMLRDPELEFSQIQISDYSGESS